MDGIGIILQNLASRDATILSAFMKESREISTETRNKLPEGEFALPQKRKYPIHDKAHARNALARVSQFGSAEEKAEVRRKVHEKFPDIGSD